MIQIKVRLLTIADAPLLLKLMASPKWHKFIGYRGVNSIADAENYIKSRMDSNLSVKGFVNYVISDAKSGNEVGTCSVHNREGVDGLDIGYAILEEYEGNGFATAAARLMVSKAFNEHGVDKVSAITTDLNIGSCRVLEKLGFLHKGYLELPEGSEQLKWYQLSITDFIEI